MTSPVCVHWERVVESIPSETVPTHVLAGCLTRLHVCLSESSTTPRALSCTCPSTFVRPHHRVSHRTCRSSEDTLSLIRHSRPSFVPCLPESSLHRPGQNHRMCREKRCKYVFWPEMRDENHRVARQNKNHKQLLLVCTARRAWYHPCSSPAR